MGQDICDKGMPLSHPLLPFPCAEKRVVHRPTQFLFDAINGAIQSIQVHLADDHQVNVAGGHFGPPGRGTVNKGDPDIPQYRECLPQPIAHCLGLQDDALELGEQEVLHVSPVVGGIGATLTQDQTQLGQVLEFLADVVVGLASEPGDLADV